MATAPRPDPNPAAPPRDGSAEAAERALIGRVALGDRAAFEQLYRAYHPRLARFLGLMTPQRALLEEVLNDTLLVVWRRAASYNHQCKLSTWIFAIAHRTALNALRDQDLPAEFDAHSGGPAAEGPDPERTRSDNEARAALDRALAALSHEQRSVLVLTYFHGLPCAEIAAIVGRPVDTVKTRMFHGRRRLRALLSGELEDWL